MLLDVVNLQNSKIGDVEVSDAVFGAEIKPYLHWEMVRYQMAKRRAGTLATKTRSARSGTTKKMYRQKGTGRARHGAATAPIFVGGGVAHGPSPRSFALRTPRKVRRGALVSLLSELVRDGRLTVVDAWAVEAPRTREAVAVLGALGRERTVVVDADNVNLQKSVRNVPTVKYLSVQGVNVYDLLQYDHLVITRDAIAQLNGALSK